MLDNNKIISEDIVGGCNGGDGGSDGDGQYQTDKINTSRDDT